MAPNNDDVIKDIVESIRQLVRAEYLDSQKMSKQYGLTGPQSLVLRLLIKNGALSSADLSRQMYVTPSNITGIIDRLEKKGLVERIRKQGDRRVALITLTQSGHEMGKTIPDPIEKKFVNQLTDLDPENLQILAMAMNQILNLIGTKGMEASYLE
ncbi:MAG: MarR family transcriptional regulator [Desulfobacteraceae bacterium]|jgi:DNA-binding MarR family transcriptional regulator|nr:MarR family transcriptional regulator [Desulfobacteraceae bacterium]